MIERECKTFIGERCDLEISAEDEARHFFLCASCNQPVDMRDLAAVLHHEVVGHAPIAQKYALRLTQISDQLRRSLASKSAPGP